MGQIKCKMTPSQTSVYATARLWLCGYPCTTMSLPPWPLRRLSVCLLRPGPVQQGSVLFEEREKSLVLVGDAVSSS